MNRYALLLLAVVLLGLPEAHAQPDRITTYPLRLEDLHSTYVLGDEYARFRKRLDEVLIGEYLARPFTPENHAFYREGFWAAEVVSETGPLVRDGVRKALRAYRTLDARTQRQTLETAYALFPKEFAREVRSVADATTTPRHFAMAALYLVRQSGAGSTWLDLERAMYRKFDGASEHPILTGLRYDILRGRIASRLRSAVPVRRPGSRRAGTTDTLALNSSPDTAFLPQDLRRELLSSKFAPGRPVVYTFQRRDRTYPGLAVIRRSGGRFSRYPDGSLVRITQMARSKSDSPGYITNGNTPQGVMTVNEVDYSRRSRFIGRTPWLYSKVPGEASAAEYFHDPALESTTWTVDLYRGQFPESAEQRARPWWESPWAPLMEAHWAGMAGRTEMLNHGTWIDPDYFTGKPFWPNAPSLGCLCAKELWDPETGKALISEQLTLVNAFIAAAADKNFEVPSPDSPVPPQPQGFVVLIELGDERRPVALDDVLLDILAAERLS